MTRKRAARRYVGLVVLTVAVVVGGCAAPDRAGGDAASEPVVLTLAQPNSGRPDQLQVWADEVKKASGGSVQIMFEDSWRLGQLDYETATIGDVRAGKADLGWVGSRAFDLNGVSTFEALQAPMLIDSLNLQDMVFEAGIPEEMMSGLDGLDLVGIGVLPGPLRKVLGVDKSFTAPSDFVGATMGIQDSAVSTMAFQAVGASTQNLPVGADLSTVDGYEVQLATIWGNHYDEVAEYTTGNLNLWPRPFVIFTGKAAFDKLSDSQKAALSDATNSVRSATITMARDQDTAALADLCAAGMTLTAASDADLAAFTEAWKPVYDKLRSTPTTKDWIDRITELKTAAASPADTATCSSVSPINTSAATPAAGPALEDGTYETVLTPADFTAYCKPGDPGAENVLPPPTTPQTLQFDVRGNRILQYQLAADGKRARGWSGTYSIFRDTFELKEDNSATGGVSSFTLENGVLTLTDMKTNNCDAKLVWTSHPWTKVPTR